MVDRPKYVQIGEQERYAFIATYLIKNPSRKTVILTGTLKQKEFFQATLEHFQVKPQNIHVQLIDEATQETLEAYGVALLVDVPKTFELLANVYQSLAGRELILVLFHINNGYIRMLKKKYPDIDIVEMKFNHHKLLAVDSRLLKLTETSYQINRMAFYAYGSYLQYFHSNLLRGIFKTEVLDVRKVAVGFGFSVPPRVKMETAVFLNKKAQNKRKKQRKIRKALKHKSREVEQKVEEPLEAPPIRKSIKKKVAKK